MTPVERALQYSKASERRMQGMAHALQMIDKNGIAGDVVECGVWRGGHIILARLLSPARRCWLFDTFTGMPKPTQNDLTRGGGSALAKYNKKTANGQLWAAASVEEVTKNLVAEGCYDKELCVFMIGDVCSVLRLPEKVLPEKIAILRLDTDWYESTKVELEVLWPRVVPGGYIIIDDYGHWLGARKATQEYFSKHYPRYVDELLPLDYTGSIMMKPPQS